jgi:uncharacterized protein (DUF488 family)
MPECVYTIGHSTHTHEQFVALLRQHGITAVADVRSRPYSRYNPQFNRENLQRALSEAGISYRFLGEELGARSEDPACYEGGKVRYDKLAETAAFQRGLQRVRSGMKEHRIALMCAEKEPLECHRTILVSRHLAILGVDVQHIHMDGALESHRDAIERLSRELDMPEEDLFRTHEDILVDSYHVQERRIAYDRVQETE